MAVKARFIYAYGDACMCQQLDCNLQAPSTRINSVTEKAQRSARIGQIPVRRSVVAA
jgi:hypothetical protein